MEPWVQLDTATVEAGAPLRLMRRGSEFAIMTGSEVLMSSRMSGSEEALARLVCAPLKQPRAAVLVGGLGMGFTLRAALETLGPDAEVVVSELVPEVITWVRGPLRDFCGGCLDDPRVSLAPGDVGVLIRSVRDRYDAIILDVDNGPDGLTRSGNDALYSRSGLNAARRALRPGGRLAVWSASPSQRFTRGLRDAGFAVEEVSARAHAGRGPRHTLWIALRS